MVYTYYPGCTLKTQAARLDSYARVSARALGFELEEIDQWQCCGAVYPLGTDEVAAKLACVRALMAARDSGRPLVTLCSACHHVMKRVNHDMRMDKDMRAKVNNYLEDEGPYGGETEVLHYLEVLHKHLGFAKLKEMVVNPLSGRKIGAYYGCMLLRPSAVMEFDDPENPTLFENFLKALGAEQVVFPQRNECCGGYISLRERERSAEMAAKVADSAARHGAEELITACPLCLYNVNKTSGGKLPVVYFTELLAQALGVEAEEEEAAHVG
ncbi:MAG: CoB--CoM heterodisulfide reductase iron-sulfur subunit B family protein [Defluviitaleaceae bacterium]|nr:CoB--CoM heterodisulfide reductase iron-sulfur subunit B family protein [Defluviitaleaceae bacterium]